MKVYRAGELPGDLGGRRPNYARRRMLLAIVSIVLLFLGYLLVPIGDQRVLLLGSDTRGNGAPARTDTMVVFRATGGMLSIPRDSLVKIEGYGWGKVNSAYTYGGADLTLKTLKDDLNVPVDRYVLVKFTGVKDVVNALGGITIDVKEPINLGIEGRVYKIDPGVQKLNGGQALAYVRWRDDPQGDIGREERQQQFLDQLVAQATSPANLPRLPAVIGAILKSTKTNMNPISLLRFALQYKLYGGGGKAALYPGHPQYINGLSFWIPDKKAAKKTIQETIG